MRVFGPAVWFSLLVASLRPRIPAWAFVARRGAAAFRAVRPARLTQRGTDGGDVTTEKYQHKEFTLTYLHKAAASGREGDRPVVLIHPVGIGLSSWFWGRVMDSYDDNPPLYAPDLIGCGLDHGADSWDPEERGLFFPLSWAEGVETLLEKVVMPRWEEIRPQSSPSGIFDIFSGDKGRGRGKCLVVAQGGLAPVGILLAHRNPAHVAHLMLTSPPSYEDVTTAVPERELQRNYNFLRSPTLGRLAFSMLEWRAVIRFFSDLFLFQGACDERWLDEAQREICVEARTPVQAFNAGLLQHRSFARELKELTQAVLVASGEGDKRVSGRRPYQSELKHCTLATVEGGCNVLPWETPAAVVDLIKELGY